MDEWYWDSTSDTYGTETFGPYDSEDEANAGIKRVQAKAKSLNDGVRRYYSAPYVK